MTRIIFILTASKTWGVADVKNEFDNGVRKMAESNSIKKLIKKGINRADFIQ